MLTASAPRLVTVAGRGRAFRDARRGGGGAKIPEAMPPAALGSPLTSLAAAAVALGAALGAAPGDGAPEGRLLVVCSPGSPGSTAEAQPTMDAFAAALGRRARVPIRAVYEPDEGGGAARLKAPAAVLALVSLPFFLEHERDLRLRARLQPAPAGRPPLERWALVAKAGRIHSPSDLGDFTVASTAGFAPAFVRGPALGGFGPLPASARVVQTGAVLSSLRRAAAGEPVAVVLDGAQAAALPSLPFAGELEVVARSAPLPAGVVAEVEGRLPPKEVAALERALRTLGDDAAGAAALEALRTTSFAPVDAAALAAARAARAGAAR